MNFHDTNYAFVSFKSIKAFEIMFLLIATLIVRLTDVNVAHVQKTLATSYSSDGRTVKAGIHREMVTVHRYLGSWKQ